MMALVDGAVASAMPIPMSAKPNRITMTASPAG